MGSLLAKVDGRNTPLTIGYHKVTVDIRDQIARTVIEESFVNHTDARLEGVFYFPLPQDASISGFGMWINGELVEADVVEKQRAREIYETILREQRDPGLLEWTGGNIFKARVFPISAHSEKRIKITYTQVLPLPERRATATATPCRARCCSRIRCASLSINVRVHSALPITRFTCTTHDARIEHDGARGAGRVHGAGIHAGAGFRGRDRGRPKRVAGGDDPAPARRGRVFSGADHAAGRGGGLGAGNGRRRGSDRIGDPRRHLGIDGRGGAGQPGRVDRGLLGSLGEKDGFDLATCDTEVRWFEGDSVEAGRARDFWRSGDSLGWTDLDQAFASAMEKLEVGRNTHVIYIGDGVVTTGDADPVAFANRLKRLYAGKAGTFHAVAPTSSYESGVLKAIASLGGGSVRRIAGSDTPSAVARSCWRRCAGPGSAT